MFWLRLFLLLTLYLTSTAGQAANFSNAQHIYAPPSGVPYGQSNSTGGNWIYNVDSAGQGTWVWLGSGPGIVNSDQTPDSGNSLGSALWNVASQAGSLPQANKLKSSLLSLVQKGKLGEAETAARQYLGFFPKDPFFHSELVTILVARAKLYLTHNDSTQAISKARQALDIEPTNKSAKSVYGQIISKQGFDADGALDHLKMGDTLAGQGKADEAVFEYRSSLALKPSAPALVGLGNIAFNKGQTAQALSTYDQALQIDPGSSLALRQRGLLKYAMHNLFGANQDLSDALVISPSDQPAANTLINLWRQQVSMDPTSVNGHLGLARAYLQTGNLEACQSEYRQVVQLDPNNPDLPAARQSVKMALLNRESQKCLEAAKTLSSAGDLSDAHAKIMEAANYSPNNTEILLYKGQLATKLGLIQEARLAYLSVLRGDPKNSEAANQLKSLFPLSAAENEPAYNTTGSGTAALTAPTAPFASDNASLANFIGSMRNIGVAQKNQTKLVEKAAQKSLQSLTVKPASHSDTGSPSASILRSETPTFAPAPDNTIANPAISAPINIGTPMPPLAPAIVPKQN